MATGIVKRHSRSCASRKDSDARCTCPKGALRYEAWVYSRREQRKIRKSFPTEAAAKAWRADSSTAVRKGTMKAPTTTKVREAAAAWLAGAKAGIIRARSGDPYKPAALRSYETSLRLRILPAIGHERLSEVTRADLKHMVEQFIATGLNASTIQVTFLPLRAIYARALDEGDVAINPTVGLRLPRVKGGRDRVASPEEAARLIDALPVPDRAVWATAMYGGLRRGELQALKWSDVDLAAGLIHVQRSWDVVEGFIDPKSAKGRRKVPIAAVLRDYLLEHRMSVEGGEPDPDALVFGQSPASPFDGKQLTRRADAAWKAAELDRIVLHEARHTFASLMIAAGVNAKALSTYMGHANISITLDRYGHLMPGNEDEAAGLLDAYLERARQATTDGAAMLTGAQTGAHASSDDENPALSREISA